MTSLWTAPEAPQILRDDAHRAALRALLLAMADDDLIMGHRHSEWTGFAPDIESDVALSSIAQDEMGHARLFYEQVAALDGTSADALAFGRAPEAFCNAVLVERGNDDWAYTIVRAYLYDHADAVRLAVLATAPLGAFGAMARAVQREEKYHLLFCATWLERLARATEESRQRAQQAVDAAWPDALGVFEPTDGVDRLVAAGAVAAAPEAQQARWLDEVRPRLLALDLRLPPMASAGPSGAGRCGRHTPALAGLLDEMTSVWRSDPRARW